MSEVPRLGPPMTVCGGCAGMGAHKRWCPVHVGAEASRRGKWSESIESMADQVGANNPIAANHLYSAAALLRADAEGRALTYIARTIAEEFDEPLPPEDV